MASHSERCLSANRFGSGEDFDCICTDPHDAFAPKAKPLPLVPMGPGEGIAELLARAQSLSPRETNWLYWFRAACNAALDSQCLKSRCGAVLVAPPRFVQQGTKPAFDGTLIASGFNAPPRNEPVYRRCGETTPSRAHPKAGRTCCVHAEVRALLSAVPRCRIEGSTLYFSRVNEVGYLKPSGRPWCTECSKLALDLGVKTWVLWHADGPREYEAGDYDRLSNQYDEEERRARERGESSDYHAHLHPKEPT